MSAPKQIDVKPVTRNTTTTCPAGRAIAGMESTEDGTPK